MLPRFISYLKKMKDVFYFKGTYKIALGITFLVHVFKRL